MLLPVHIDIQTHTSDPDRLLCLDYCKVVGNNLRSANTQ